MDEEITRLARTCPRCGKALPTDAPEGLCAACLLSQGIETLTGASIDQAPTMLSGDAAAEASIEDARLERGQTWGSYRIGRLLGRGGMGEVYEAEHAESGRRLALKVLRRRLQQADDRARFLREGQLAASISHPHTVYIFGSEEIGGMPVISMELLPGGTLKDRVAAHGPLPVADAVSAVLDIIGGLDAAQAAGILHRDIKPSNCFIDAEGAVKVGDFGLSISTLARDVRGQLATGGFQGTPHFAPPEQLRGEPLDVRADIYAVGATLYYLLTGRPPFDAPDLQTLVVRVTAEAPASPRALRHEIPSGLAIAVLQCLAKSPSGRPPSYAALAEALRPFARMDERPAPPGLRTMAGVVDVLVAGVPWVVWSAATTDITVSSIGSPRSGIESWSWLVAAVYFFAFEAWWTGSPGKRLFGLGVTCEGAHRARKIAARTAVFHLPYLIFTLGTLIVGPLPTLATRRLWGNFTLNGGDMTGLMAAGIVYAMVAALFVTARRHNGWTGLHELTSGTRVVSRVTARRPHGRSADAANQGPHVEGGRDAARLGPFIVPGYVPHRVRETTLVGFDPLLRREVWIHVLPPGSSPIDSTRRDTPRATKLHWLTGRRSPTENWDAFEAPDGGAFAARGQTAVAWPVLKSWLLDLADELLASEREGSIPALRLDRLWIRRDGRLVLLDFASPLPAPRAPAGPQELTPPALLSAVASQGARLAAPAALPLGVRALIDTWASHPPATTADARAALATVAASPDAVSRRRRALPIVLAATPTISIALVVVGVALPTMYRFFGRETTEMLALLEWVYQSDSGRGGPWADAAKREAAAIYLAGRHRSLMLDESFWASPLMRELRDRLQPVAARVAGERTAPSEGDVASAALTLQAELTREGAQRAGGFVEMGSVILTALTGFSLLLTMVCGLASAVVVRGGMVTRLLGLAVVDRRGREIGRWRSLARTALAWLPALVWLAYLAVSPRVQGFVPAPAAPLVGTTIALALMGIGAIWTVARPARGPHDWLAGAWVVPR